MTYKVIISDVALLDIESAYRYIRFTLQNEKAADELLDKADDTFMSLADFPERFQLVNDPLLSSSGIRAVNINNYIAFYIIDESDKIAYIVRFIYSRRDWAKLLASIS